MMSNIGDEINRKLYEGIFPSEMLTPAEVIKYHRINIEQEANNALNLLKDNPELFYTIFITSHDRMLEMQSSSIPNTFTQEINIIVNSGYHPKSVSIMSSAYQNALSLNPVVTELDKTLWMAAHLQYFSGINEFSENPSASCEMAYALIYLLWLVQQKELTTGLTINIQEFKPLTDFLNLILSSWENNTIYSVLSKQEQRNLNYLINQRSLLSKLFQAEIEKAAHVANNTSEQWNTFLTIINDIKIQESNTINVILNNRGTKRDKLSAINDYDYILLGIKNHRYSINGNEIALLPVFDAIIARFQKAYVHCTVRIGDSDPFQITPAIFMLAMDPSLTFNYLLLSFHKFRMHPNRENTNKFINLALSCLKKNLSIHKADLASINNGLDEWDMIEKTIVNMTSLDEKVIDFYASVKSFYDNNYDIIESLSFDSIQADSSAVLFSSDGYDDDKSTYNWIKQQFDIASQKIDKVIDDVFEGANKPENSEEILKQYKHLMDLIHNSEQRTIARQIIASLNIIYMFCEALRIILSDTSTAAKVHDFDLIKHYRYKLLKIDDQLVHIVYSHMSGQDFGILEYREKKGFNPSSLSDQETKAEQYRNELFSEVLKDAINRISSHLEDDANDQLLAAKAQIKEEILRFPDCDEKEQYADWLDSISEKINCHLINNCKKESDKYARHKATILSSLGNKCSHLPDSTIDSLTTAEMLFEEYATEEYSQKGFDFSCISALYYQAFENAYNFLVWQQYACQLNRLIVDGSTYTSILDQNRNTYDGLGSFMNAAGYLPSRKDDRAFYVLYRNRQRPQTQVNERCMYKSFGIIMENIKSHSALPKFCDYFSRIAGFGSSAEMMSNSTYMQICADFSARVIASADNRNNASHGGTLITLHQCSDDKKTIINELEEVRLSSIGLIQQLLYLVFSHEN